MPARPARVLLLAAALLSGACGPRLPASPGASKEVEQIFQILAAAQAELKAGRWDDAAVGYRKAAEVAGDDPRLGGWRDAATYDLACVHARAGRRDEAAAAFAQSVAAGLRPRLRPDRGGHWVVASDPLSLPHILADPDLESIRDLPAFTDALKPYLGGGGEGVGWVLAEIGDAGGNSSGGEGRLPVLAAFASPGIRVALQAQKGERGEKPTVVPVAEVALWRKTASGAAPFLLADVRGPVCGDPPAEAKSLEGSGGKPVPMPYRRWLLEDGDDRWALAHAGRVLDAVAAAAVEGRADAGRVFLFAEGRDAATAAWAAALAMPERVAGICAVGATFHREAWADAVAAVPAKRAGKAPWKVIVGPRDEAAAEAMQSIGIEVTRTDAPSARRAAMDAATAQ